MPLFIVQLFKTHSMSNRPWSNVYLLRAGSLALAEGSVGTILEAERAFHHSTVLFTYARTSTLAPNDNAYSTLSINSNGLRGGAGDFIPLYNTARVDFNVAGGGRPSRKFYRLPLQDGDQENGNLLAALQAAMDSALESMIVTLGGDDTPMVDPDDQLILNANVQVAVQMRQLHRKRRRTVAP